MGKLIHGQVVLYSYLWWREHVRGEQSGRKTRPACVMVIVGEGRHRRAVLFPITSSEPTSQTMALEIPEIEAKRCGLYTPAWVVVDEFNSDDPERSYALDDSRPLGSFSRKFLGQIAAAAARAARSAKPRVVPRDSG